MHQKYQILGLIAPLILFLIMVNLKSQNTSIAYVKGPTIKIPDFDFKDIDRLLILGPSGSGKSSFIRAIAGLQKVEQGQLTLNEHKLQSLSNHERSLFRKNYIGYINQMPHFFEGLTVLENLQIANPSFNIKQAKNKKSIIERLKKIGLEGLEQRLPNTLSQGQQQRVAILRAILKQPLLLLADEPTASLDDINCVKTINFLFELCEQNKTTLLVSTHDQRIKNRFTHQLTLS